MALTQSSTQLEPVVVERDPSGLASHVWLRRDICEKEVPCESGDGTYTVYEADELHILVAGTPTAEEVAASFDSIWDRALRALLTLDDRVTSLEETMQVMYAGLD